MSWEKEAITRVRRARLQANNLRHTISELNHGLDGECVWAGEAIRTVDGLINDLFDLEGELSRPA